jgi:hypothetical protein
MHAIRTLKNLVITPWRSAAPAGFRHPGIGPIKKVKSRTFLLDSYPENARAAKCSIGQLRTPSKARQANRNTAIMAVRPAGWLARWMLAGW